ncbi:MAG TPA: 5-(carboxyamino)imidazole ribonucleotide synthase, partial [Elusimicrobiota bacterium]|nr:5-(carboxyamino)imidazole ribonucleotide synthase [Elusimicrobiota bacterium]
RPDSRGVVVAQNRILEKIFLRDAGLATAPFAPVTSEMELESAWAAVGSPALLKTARLGYDGKGQAAAGSLDEARRAWKAFGGKPCVLEKRVPLDVELSVVLARGADGACAAFPAAENRHQYGILDVTIVPADVPGALAREAEDAAKRIAEKLDYVGVLAVEFFVSDGKLLVNEIAPRPHNSGHYTLDACATSQFEQQVRALCGLPLGDCRLLTPAVMVNLLGDLWPEGGQPAWEAVLANPGAKLHLYGKAAARPGRKMGHFTVLGADRDRALEDALRIQGALRGALQNT